MGDEVSDTFPIGKTDSITARETTKNPDSLWAQPYKPWRLVADATVGVGLQFAILLIVFYSVSPLSQKWGSKMSLVMSCERGPPSLWDGPCEATKAGVLSFPLFAASVSVIMMVRYYAQMRLFFLLLVRGAIIKFPDIWLTSLLISFGFGISHFIIDYFRPPYLLLAGVARICTVYIFQSVLFFAVMLDMVDVPRHFVSLGEMLSEDPKLAKRIADKHLVISQATFIRSASRVIAGMTSREVYSMDWFLQRVLDHHRSNHRQSQVQQRTATLFSLHDRHSRGIWPVALLSGQFHCSDSMSTRMVCRTLKAWMILAMLAVLALLTYMAWEEVVMIYPMQPPAGAVRIGENLYETIGAGHCRDAKGARPDGCLKVVSCPDSGQSSSVGSIGRADGEAFLQVHHQRSQALDRPSEQGPGPADARKHSEFEPPSCLQTVIGDECNKERDQECLGFSYARGASNGSLAALYFRGQLDELPSGWTRFDTDLSGGGAVFNVSVIVALDYKEGVECMRKFDNSPRRRTIGGVFVYGVHIVLTALLAIQSWREMNQL